MRVGVEGRERQGQKTVRAQIETKQAWDVERRGTPREVGVRRRRLDASPRLDVRALAFLKQY